MLGPKTYDTGKSNMKAKTTRYKVHFTDGAEQIVRAMKYDEDQQKKRYVFTDENKQADQFFQVVDVQWIAQDIPSLTVADPETFKLIHEEIHKEHTLISNCLTWYVTSQAFLATALAIAGGKDHTLPWLPRLLPIAGIVISALILFSIVAAMCAMHHFRQKEFAMGGPFAAVPTRYHVFGLFAPVIIPTFLLGGWIYVLTKL
jgi:hypothetical protein